MNELKTGLLARYFLVDVERKRTWDCIELSFDQVPIPSFLCRRCQDATAAKTERLSTWR